MRDVPDRADHVGKAGGPGPCDQRTPGRGFRRQRQPEFDVAKSPGTKFARDIDDAPEVLVTVVGGRDEDREPAGPAPRGRLADAGLERRAEGVADHVDPVARKSEIFHDPLPDRLRLHDQRVGFHERGAGGLQAQAQVPAAGRPSPSRVHFGIDEMRHCKGHDLRADAAPVHRTAWSEADIRLHAPLPVRHRQMDGIAGA